MEIVRHQTPAGDELVESRKNWIGDHLAAYQADGHKAHFVDLRDMGGYEYSATMLVKFIGRKTGKPYIRALGYFMYGNEVILAASKGGYAEHPSWYLNLQAQKDVRFQIAEDRFVGPWRLVEGPERAKIWDYMATMYPPFLEYEKATTREIPVVALTRRERIDAL